jgi:hypothetical protein
MLLNWQRAARIGTQLRCKARGRSFKFAGQPAFAKTFLAGCRINLSTWLGQLHDGRESGAFTSGAFEFRVNFI